MALLNVLKTKKFWLLVVSLVVTAIVAGVCRVLDVGEETTAMVVNYTLALFGGGLVGGHILTDIISMVFGLQKTKKV